MRLVLTGGGTMGHVLPNFAVIEELKTQLALKDESLEILYIGSYMGPERKAVKNFRKKTKGVKIKFRAIHTGKLRRRLTYKNVVDAMRVPLGVVQAFSKMLIYRPKLVFSKGGYVSTPVCVAAKLLRIPVILHESDVNPGLANKICAKFAKTICVSFEETINHFPKRKRSGIVVTGNPIRKEVLEGDRETGFKVTHCDRDKPVLLVMGGSQGAEQINNLVRQNIDSLVEKFNVLHIVGRWKVMPRYRQKGYMQFEYVDEDLQHFYAISDFIVSRGGANSLAEIEALGIPALIVPLKHVGRGDQIKNAEIFASKNAGIVLGNDEDFMNQIEKLSKLSKGTGVVNEATKKIVKLIL